MSKRKDYEYVRINLPEEIVKKAIEICEEEGLRFGFPSTCIQHIIASYYNMKKQSSGK